MISTKVISTKGAPSVLTSRSGAACSRGGRQRSRLHKWAAFGLGALLLPACMHNGPTIYDDPSAIAVLLATTGSSVHGAVTFVRMGDVTLVNANLAGLKPNSTNEIQIYERGDCTARDASSAGERFDPVASAHDAASVAHQSGNLGAITADAKGQAYETFEVAEGAFGTGADSIIGRGLIVQAVRDGSALQPAASSGARLACGIITRNADRTTYAMAKS